MNATGPDSRVDTVKISYWAQTGMAILLPAPVVVTFLAVNVAAARAMRAVGDQPDLRRYVGNYRASSAQALLLVFVVAVVFAALLLRRRSAGTGGRVAALVWPWIAFLFVLCASRANPSTGWRLTGSEGDYVVNDYLPGDGYLKTLATLAFVMGALCLVNTVALLWPRRDG